ncbi:unnamed protein product [Prunus armeniaca]
MSHILFYLNVVGVPSSATEEERRPIAAEDGEGSRAETVKEAYLQVTGKRHIEGTLDVTPLPKRPRGPSEDAAIPIPGDKAEEDAELINVVCPQKVVPFVNCMIDGAQMEMSKLEQLLAKTVHEQAGRVLPLQAADMEIWLCMKRAVNAA